MGKKEHARDKKYTCVPNEAFKIFIQLTEINVQKSTCD